jgi:hypothetical protein
LHGPSGSKIEKFKEFFAGADCAANIKKMEGADSEQKAEASFLLKSGNQAAGTFDANVSNFHDLCNS